MSMRLYQELNKPENGLILTNIEAFYNENEQGNIDEAGENAEVIPEPQTVPEMGLSAKTKKQRTLEKKKELQNQKKKFRESRGKDFSSSQVADINHISNKLEF